MTKYWMLLAMVTLIGLAICKAQGTPIKPYYGGPAQHNLAFNPKCARVFHDFNITMDGQPHYVPAEKYIRLHDRLEDCEHPDNPHYQFGIPEDANAGGPVVWNRWSPHSNDATPQATRP